jgi:hypothetical protein
MPKPQRERAKIAAAKSLSGNRKPVAAAINQPIAETTIQIGSTNRGVKPAFAASIQILNQRIDEMPTLHIDVVGGRTMLRILRPIVGSPCLGRWPTKGKTVSLGSHLVRPPCSHSSFSRPQFGGRGRPVVASGSTPLVVPHPHSYTTH